MKFSLVAILAGFLYIAAVSAAPSSSGKNNFNSLFTIKKGSDGFVEPIKCAYGVIGEMVANDEALKEVFDKEKAITDKLIVELEKCVSEECYYDVNAQMTGSFERLLQHIFDVNFKLGLKIMEQFLEKCCVEPSHNIEEPQE